MPATTSTAAHAAPGRSLTALDLLAIGSGVCWAMSVAWLLSTELPTAVRTVAAPAFSLTAGLVVLGAFMAVRQVRALRRAPSYSPSRFDAR